MRKVTAIAGLALWALFGLTSLVSAKPVMVIEVAGEANGTIEIELFEDAAPNHVEQIRKLIREGHYDDVVFHRVIDGFMAQTGDVQHGKSDNFDLRYAGTGSSDLPDIKAEFSDIPFSKGVVGMARAADPNSANSQFFIMFDDAPHLNGQYTAIGRVISGQDVVDQIRRGDSAVNGAVAEPDVMTTVTLKEN